MSGDIYHTREVRDLAWACFSPPMLHSNRVADADQNIDNCGLHLTPARLEWLRAIDRQPASLHQHLNKLHNSRLGLYFESLWHFFLEQDPQVDLLAHNLAVRTPQMTVGEFDCLYYCHQRQRHIHLELAVKYYLSNRDTTTTERSSHWSEWLGPNNKDNLDRKISHLTQHQIQLGEHPAAEAALHQLGINELCKEVEIKGYLFQSQADPMPAPHAFNSDLSLSAWLTIDELGSFLRVRSHTGYSVLEKSHWLAPELLNLAAGHSLTAEALIQQLSDGFLADNRPQLIAACGDDGSEIERFFVTNLNWPLHSN